MPSAITVLAIARLYRDRLLLFCQACLEVLAISVGAEDAEKVKIEIYASEHQHYRPPQLSFTVNVRGKYDGDQDTFENKRVHKHYHGARATLAVNTVSQADVYKKIDKERHHPLAQGAVTSYRHPADQQR